MTIEDIILDHDKRGVGGLRRHLPADFCDQAAEVVLANPGTAIIATGFYIVYGGAVESDGPAGAVAIGDALRSLGYEVVYATDKYAAPLMASVVDGKARVVEFPIADAAASDAFARRVLDDVRPSVVISIERCGQTHEGLYRNMRGVDITQYNARLDSLFTHHPCTVGIGDGGNEIGMGNLASVIPQTPGLVQLPCVTPVTKLIVASVSNWGGYGLVAAMSKRAGRNLLPSVEQEQALVRRTVDLGAVDGISGKSEYRVDAFTLEENSRIVARLHEHLEAAGLSRPGA